MRRLEFIGLVGTAAVWPLTARGQYPERARRIGILSPGRTGLPDPPSTCSIPSYKDCCNLGTLRDWTSP
jgi:hypothetical protein